MELRMKTDNLELIRLDECKVTSYSRNHIFIVFDFDIEWIDLCKYALFITPDKKQHVVYLGYGKVKKCLIPKEVLQNTFFMVSVFADDLLTSTQLNVIVHPSGYTNDIDSLDIDSDSNVSVSDDDVIIHRLPEENVYIRPQKEFERHEHLKI